MNANMSLTVIGCAHYQLDNGPLSQVFVMVNDPDNKSIKGYALAKMSASDDVVKNLPQDSSQYPLTADFEVTNKVSGGKLTQHIQRYIQPSAKPIPKAPN